MSFTATGEPSNLPPRVLLTADTDVAGATFNSLTITRDGVPIRSQPPVGTQATSAYDYEMPFGTLVEYAASGDYLPFVAPDWTENWASLAAWTGSGWSLGAGDTVESTVYAATITRSASDTIQRVEVTDPANVSFQLWTAADELVALVNVGVDGVTPIVTLYAGDGGGTVETSSSSFSLTLLDGTVTATAADASWTLEANYTGAPIKVNLVSIGGEFAETSSFSTTGDADRVYVAATGNIFTIDIVAKLVRKFNSAGVFQTSWSTTGTPSGIAVDSVELVYVTDRTNNLVRKYGSSGTPVTTWSTTGTPLGLGIDSGNAVYVLDGTNVLVRKYTNTGAADITWAPSGATDIAVAPDGSVYIITDPDVNEVEKYTSAGAAGTPAFFSANTFPESTIHATNSEVHLADVSPVIQHYSTAGVNTGSTSISPALAEGMATTAAGALLIGDTSNNTMRVFSASTATVGIIEVSPAVVPVAFYEVTTVTLTIDEAWLIHPGQPTLSVSIDAGPNAWRDPGLNVDIASAQQTNAPSAVTLHQPVGRTRTVAIAHGNRLEELWALVLLAPTLADRDDVRAITRDQTPLLLRSPESFGWDLTDGYYSIGDVAYDRPFAPLNYVERRITLPLTPSDPPVVRIATDRTWDEVVEQNDTWATVVLTYDTWTDLLLGTS